MKLSGLNFISFYFLAYPFLKMKICREMGLKSEAEVYASMKRSTLGKNKFNTVKTSLLNEPPPIQLGKNIGLCYYSQLKNSNF